MLFYLYIVSSNTTPLHFSDGLHRLVFFYSMIFGILDGDLLISVANQTTFDIRFINSAEGECNESEDVVQMLLAMRIDSLDLGKERRFPVAASNAIGTLMDLVAQKCCHHQFEYPSVFRQFHAFIGGTDYIDLLLKHSKFSGDSDVISGRIEQQLASLLHRRRAQNSNDTFNEAAESNDRNLDCRFNLCLDGYETFFKELLGSLEVLKLKEDFLIVFDSFWKYWSKKQQANAIQVSIEGLSYMVHQFCCYFLIRQMFNSLKELPSWAVTMLLKCDIESNCINDASSFMNYFLHEETDGRKSITIFPSLVHRNTRKNRGKAVRDHVTRSFEYTWKSDEENDRTLGGSMCLIALTLCLNSCIDPDLFLTLRELLQVATTQRDGEQLLRCLYSYYGVFFLFSPALFGKVPATHRVVARKAPATHRVVAPSVIETVYSIKVLKELVLYINQRWTTQSPTSQVFEQARSILRQGRGAGDGLKIELFTGFKISLDFKAADLTRRDAAYLLCMAHYNELLESIGFLGIGHGNFSFNWDMVEKWLNSLGITEYQDCGCVEEERESLCTSLVESCLPGMSPSTLSLSFSQSRSTEVLQRFLHRPLEEDDQNSQQSDDDRDRECNHHSRSESQSLGSISVSVASLPPVVAVDCKAVSNRGGKGVVEGKRRSLTQEASQQQQKKKKKKNKTPSPPKSKKIQLTRAEFLCLIKEIMDQSTSGGNVSPELNLGEFSITKARCNELIRIAGDEADKMKLGKKVKTFIEKDPQPIDRSFTEELLCDSGPIRRTVVRGQDGNGSLGDSDGDGSQNRHDDAVQNNSVDTDRSLGDSDSDDNGRRNRDHDHDAFMEYAAAFAAGSRSHDDNDSAGWWSDEITQMEKDQKRSSASPIPIAEQGQGTNQHDEAITKFFF